jgi:hypothetical protein
MDTLKIREDLVYREIDEAIVAVRIDTGEYIRLDEIGSDIFRLIAADGRFSSVRAGLLSRYDIDEATCDADLVGFIGDLQARGLINVDGN